MSPLLSLFDRLRDVTTLSKIFHRLAPLARLSDVTLPKKIPILLPFPDLPQIRQSADHLRGAGIISE